MRHRPAGCPHLVILMLVIAGLPSATGAQSTRGADALAVELLSGMSARSIGPAGMSGRVAAVDAVRSDPNIIYVGGATGGVWKSSDGGLTWDPVFDGQPVQGIGAVQVFDANPDIVWVGTGEGNPRNSAGVGNGVYRSRDGGRSWRHLGLERSERIHRIVPHPTDPNTAYVGAMGPAWSDGEERGVYRTRDGGESWERVLFTNVRSGAADLVMDPSNPDKLYAAMWEFRRWPWHFESGGPGSGLFVTYDGGDTWERRTDADGLPRGDLGRIGIGVSHSSPSVVYALVEATRSELVRSRDGGRTFETVSAEPGIVPRPFYYADLRVDPANENRIYSLHGSIQVSEDGGRTFSTVVPSQIIHGDVQELWIHPEDPRFLIMGNDGGIGISSDRGAHWRFVENLALAQFYHISVDDAVPFNVYGGLQDNGSWYGPSTVWENRGIMNGHWRRVGGGDGFSVLHDFSDPGYGYSMSQGGNLARFDKATGQRKSIRPVHPEGITLRFNWNAGLTMDPIDSTTIYLGSQFVHRSRDQGATWEIISPDLTTNDPAKQRQDQSGGLTLDATGAENHTTILSIAPSPVDPSIIWVGTDDGRVQLTRDAGTSWTDVGARIQGVPNATWVSHVEASRHDPARAWVVFDDHRRGNWTPYLYRTLDYGRTWERVGVEGVFGFLHVVEEDPVEPDLVFLGSEFGLYVSLNGGGSWLRWTHGLPAAPVRDLVVHTRDHDLVIATHGRGAYVLDDVRPLRALAGGADRSRLSLFDPPPALQVEIAEAIGYRSVGHAMFFGEMRPVGALLSFWNPGSERGRYRMTVRDRDGRALRTLQGAAAPGLNRAAWDLRMDVESVAGLRAPVLAGVYRVTVAIGGDSASAEVEVRPDPRRPYDRAGRVAKLEALERVGRWGSLTDEARRRISSARTGVAAARETVGAEADGALVAELRELDALLAAAEEELFTGPSCQGICGGTTVAQSVRRPLGPLGSSGDVPTANERLMMEQAREAAAEIVSRVNALFDGPVAAARQALRAAGYTPFRESPPLEVPR